MLKKFHDIRIAALALFALMAILHLAPLSFHPFSGLNDSQDCLLNTWIMAWDQDQIFRNPLKLFSANVFYPHPNTLSFSEHLLPAAILSLPVRWLTGNPVAAYNFVFFASVVLNGLFMFLLVRHLARNDAAALISGTVFAFAPYQMMHLPHIQIFSSWLIPATFLYLIRFFEGRRLRDSTLFSLFFALQGLSCIYYGLFLPAVLLLVVPLLLLIHRKNVNLRFLSKLAGPMIPAIAVLAVLSLPYLSLLKTYRFQRMLEPGADLVNYLAAQPSNLIWGKLTRPLGGSERFLFPGLLALILAAGAAFIGQSYASGKMPKSLKIGFASAIGASLIAALVSIIPSGFHFHLGSLSVSSHNTSKPVFLTLALIVLFTATAFAFSLRDADIKRSVFFVFPAVVFWALFLSFGKEPLFLRQSPLQGTASASTLSPYSLFYNHVPGFKGIRVPSRLAVFVLFGLAVLAGYGAKTLFCAVRKRHLRIALAAGILALMNLEYLSIPQSLAKIPTGKSVPPTYAWLKEQPGEGSVMETPLFGGHGDEAIYMYFSLAHGKKLVNGYSGFIPPANDYLRSYFRGFPSWGCVDIMRKLGVRYMILHPGAWKAERAETIIARLDGPEFRDDLRLVKRFRYPFTGLGGAGRFFGDDLVYEILPRSPNPEPSFRERELPSDRWAVTSNQNPQDTPHLQDGNLETRWSTGRPRKTDDYLLIELRGEESVSRISLDLGGTPMDFAQDLKVSVSRDAITWIGIPKPYSPGEFTISLAQSPRNAVQHIRIYLHPVRFVKIVHLGNDPSFAWSLAEIKVFVN